MRNTDSLMKRSDGRMFGVLFAVVAGLILCLTLTACGGGSSITGTWTSESGSEILSFENDKTCSVPFTYSAGWMESCDRYTVKDDGTLVLSSSQGNVGPKSYKKVSSKQEALGNSSNYYLVGNELVINKTTYKRG